MKKCRILLSVLLITGITACNNFLDVTPKNVISMDDMESIKKSLAGFLYNIRENGNGGNSLPRSPFECPVVGLVEYTPEWDLSKYAEKINDSKVRTADWRSETTQSLWSNYYSPIGFMNLIIHEAETAKGDEAMRDYVMGEAYAMRAYCFFKLVQLFAPYKNNELGIPVCLETYEDFEKVSLKRSTQKEVYKQILSDLHEAEIRLERTPSHQSYNLMYTTSVVNRLYAEVYHFKAMSAAAETDDWKNAAHYANRETLGKALVSDSASFQQIFNSEIAKLDKDPECGLRVYAWGGGYDFSSLFGSIEPNQEFYKTYFSEKDDVRRKCYYKVVTYYDYGIWDYVTAMKINKFSNYTAYYSAGYLHMGFRLAEMFLIEAEALAMTDQLTEAKAIFRRFKEARYSEVVSIPETKEKLLQDIYRERKKEFLAEGDISWLDMKRLGDTAERTIGGETYKLNGEGDYRYAFPIPNSELSTNREIRQNPGWILND